MSKPSSLVLLLFYLVSRSSMHHSTYETCICSGISIALGDMGPPFLQCSAAARIVAIDSASADGVLERVVDRRC